MRVNPRPAVGRGFGPRLYGAYRMRVLHAAARPVSCENGDPGSPFSWENGDPGPYFHNFLGTPGSPFSQEIGDPLMKMGTPSAIHF